MNNSSDKILVVARKYNDIFMPFLLVNGVNVQSITY